MDVRGPEWHTPDNGPIFPDAGFPLAPESIRGAYKQFWLNTPQVETELRTAQHDLMLTNTLIADFCDEYVNTPFYSAATLGPIADALSDPTTSAAAEQSLRNYAQANMDEPERTTYVLGVLADRPVIATFWEQDITEQYADNSELVDQLLSKTAGAVPKELWEADARLVPLDRMLDLVDSINLESLLIQSVETLIKLGDDKATNCSETLQLVYKAESFLGPLCEIIGFDGLAMALRSRANILRAAYTGNQWAVERATGIIEQQGSVEDVDQNVQSLFSTIFGDSAHAQVIGHTSKHGIIIGEGTCTSKDLRVVWRQKTIGSLVEKILRQNDPDFIPLDILGATIIAHDEQEAGERLGRIIERLHKDDNVKLVSAEGRTDAAYVKGTPEYIEKMRIALGFDSVESMRRFVEVKEAGRGEYQICKVTLVYSQDGKPDIRAEIQITTESDRIEARIGSAAHLIYKTGGDTLESVDPVFLAAIRGRKSSLIRGRNHLNGISAKRAAALYQQLITT